MKSPMATERLKVCVIGGGSTYTPELFDGLLRRQARLPVGEVYLLDVDAARVDIVGRFATRMAEAAGVDLSVRWGTDVATALTDADFVVLQLRVGGQKGRLADERLGLDFGLIGQETTGVGGFSCALRTIPVVLDLAEQIRRLAPEAELINFTNPSGLITELLLRYTSLRAIGLCNIPWNMRVDVARLLDARPEDVELDYVGLNHLSWVRGARAKGEDRTDEMLQRFRSENRAGNGEPEIPEACLADLQAVPSYYLLYYYETQAMLDHQRSHPSRARQVMDIEEALLRRFRDPELREKPAELMQRGGAYYSEAAACLMEDLWNDTGATHVVNVRNQGAVPGYPADVVVEVPARIDRKGAHAIEVAPVRPEMDALMRTVKDYELLTIAAAVEGDSRLARLALLTHPLGPDTSQVQALWDRLRCDHAGALGRLDA